MAPEAGTGNGHAPVAEFAAPPAELLRVATAGSVDDGKSTLLGRLLYDSRLIPDDHLAAIERSRFLRGDPDLNLALLTDGLRAEREQGITIDVAYRFFATPRRRFIVADTPGHVQYTRNMVTGASTADVALILVDARRGLTQQSRRHALIASILRVPHLLLCINKMDLVDFDERVYDRIRREFGEYSAKLTIHDLTFIPVSALHGDNVVDRSPRTPWYGGPSLIHYLENVHIQSDRNLIDVRLPIQWVMRPSAAAPDERRYAGQVASGTLKPGDEVVVLPSGRHTRIRSIDTFDGPVAEAVPPLAVTVTLEDDVDVARGDMLARPRNLPESATTIEALVCWMGERPLRPGARYSLKHLTRVEPAVVDRLEYRLDVDTLHRDQAATQLDVNEIGRVTVRVPGPLFFDEYARNRTTGSFILIEPGSETTVGAGMILGPTR